MSLSMFMSSIITQPLTSNFGENLNVRKNQKENVVFVMGATGTGKSKLSIDLAKYFQSSEIINSDKLQIYKGLDIVTNKITKEEQKGIQHHLLGTHDPNIDFTSNDFCKESFSALESITGRENLPIIAGGSNSYLAALVDNKDYNFQSKYNFCCLWVDVPMPILDSYLDQRINQMVKRGMVNELRPFYNPDGDYTKGIRTAIGVPEFDEYFRNESFVDDETKKMLLKKAVSEMKMNTRKLARKQVQKINWLKVFKGWEIHRLDATPVFKKSGKEADETWNKIVLEHGAMIVERFLRNSTKSTNVVNSLNLRVPISQGVMAA